MRVVAALAIILGLVLPFVTDPPSYVQAIMMVVAGAYAWRTETRMSRFRDQPRVSVRDLHPLRLQREQRLRRWLCVGVRDAADLHPLPRPRHRQGRGLRDPERLPRSRLGPLHRVRRRTVPASEGVRVDRAAGRETRFPARVFRRAPGRPVRRATTSSAELSAEFQARLFGSDEGHIDCVRIEDHLPAVTRSIKLAKAPTHTGAADGGDSYNHRREIVELLSDDLFKRVDEDDHETTMTWVSPLGWKVKISGPRDEPLVEIFHPTPDETWASRGLTDKHPPASGWGSLFARIEKADVATVHNVLP